MKNILLLVHDDAGQEARLQVEKTDIVVNVARNNLLPKVDLVAGLQTTGLDNGFDAAFGSTFDPTNGWTGYPDYADRFATVWSNQS